MNYEDLIKKKTRIKKQRKKRFAKTSGTFSGQVKRGEVNRGYAGAKGKARVVVKIWKKEQGLLQFNYEESRV